MITQSVHGTQMDPSLVPTYGKKEMGKEEFLKLLILQLQNQDPTEPIKNEEFVAQLAQFNALEQMQNLNKTMSSLGNLQIIAQTSSLIGKTVIAENSDQLSIQGKVTSVDLSTGSACVMVESGGKTYPVTIDMIKKIMA